MASKCLAGKVLRSAGYGLFSLWHPNKCYRINIFAIDLNFNKVIKSKFCKYSNVFQTHILSQRPQAVGFIV